MTVFISYARANQAVAEQLRADVERCHREAWVDQELTGGQAWWRAILHHIRSCDVFIAALSPQWVHSKACDLELRYAISVRRPVLPVMVAKIDPRLAPPVIADAQIVNYLQRSPEATFALRDALDMLPNAPPLPSSLPPEPPAPISYLHNIITALNAPVLDPRNQYWLWQQLRAALDEVDDDERPGLLQLVSRLRKRRDLVSQLYREIDAVLEPPTTPRARPVPPPTAPVWTTPTQVRSVPMHVPQPPARAARQRGCLVVVAVAVAAVVVGFSAWIGNRDRPGGTAAVPPANSTTTSVPPDTETDTDPGGDSGGGVGNPPPAQPPPPETFQMPKIEGLTPDDARGQLESEGWEGQFDDPVQTDNCEPEQNEEIVDQEPEPDTKQRVDVTVRVTVCSIGTDTTPPPLPPENG